MNKPYVAALIILIVVFVAIIFYVSTCAPKLPSNEESVVSFEVTDDKKASNQSDPLVKYQEKFDVISPVMDDPIDEADLLYRLYIIVSIQKQMEHDESLKHNSEYNRLWAAMDSKINSIRLFFLNKYKAIIDNATSVEQVQKIEEQVYADMIYPYHMFENEEAFDRFMTYLNERKAYLASNYRTE